MQWICSHGKASAVSKVSTSSPGCIHELDKSFELESGGAGKRGDEELKGGDIQISPPQKLPSEMVKFVLPGLLPASVCKSVRTLWLTQMEDQQPPGKRSRRKEFN